jgi:hypothetical protein
MAIYGIIENSVVVNTIIWNGPTGSADEWVPPAGSSAVLIPDGVVAGIGYTYDATTQIFSAPPMTTGA